MAAVCVLQTVQPAFAQSTTSPSADEGWRINVYPVLLWVPTGLGMEVALPPSNAGDAGFVGKIVEARFDGAFFGGFSAARGPWRFDASGLWAAIGGDRVERPAFHVDADVIYAHVSAGRKLFSDLYATAGVRRLALKYEIAVDDLGNFERKPGVWDPVVGLGWHSQGRWFELHAAFEAGGFGVGTDLELAGELRVDWKPFRHFGLTAGYHMLYFELEDTAINRQFRVEQTLQGPMIGLGFYF